MTLATKNDESEPEIAQALKEMACPGGFDITLDITEPSGYWDRWTEVDLGITAWTHRPLATMVLPLAYTEEAIGNWNETRWTDEEFATLLRQAEGTLDVDARRETDVQHRGDHAGSRPHRQQLLEEGVEHHPRPNSRRMEAHPTSYYLLYEVWKERTRAVESVKLSVRISTGRRAREDPEPCLTCARPLCSLFSSSNHKDG